MNAFVKNIDGVSLLCFMSMICLSKSVVFLNVVELTSVKGYSQFSLIYKVQV